jgi:hypothetical protein
MVNYRPPPVPLRPRPRGPAWRLLPLFAVLGASACFDLTGLGDLSRALGPTLDGIVVTATDTILVAGDTARVAASGRVTGALGFLVYDRLLDAEWSVSDPAVATITPVPIPSSDTVSVARVRLDARAPGTVTVTARARGRRGAVVVRVRTAADAGTAG